MQNRKEGRQEKILTDKQEIKECKAKHRPVKWVSEGLLVVPTWSGLDSCKTMA